MSKLFGFNLPIEQVIALGESDSVHVYWKDRASCYLGCNDIQRKLIYVNTGCADIIGKSSVDFFQPPEAKILKENDYEVVRSNSIKLFAESAWGAECLSLKSQLKDAANQLIGILGISFYLHEIALLKIVSMINQLYLTPQQLSRVMYHSIANSNLPLSKREKECVYYIVKGMSAKEIGSVLSISARTVESYLERIKAKLNYYTRSQIVSRVLGE